MICTMEAQPSQATGFHHPKQNEKDNQHHPLDIPEDESAIATDEPRQLSNHTTTSSLMTQAGLKSFSEDDASNRKAQVIQRFVRSHVLSSACRRAAFKKEKQHSIGHPSLLLHDDDGDVVERRVSSITMTDLDNSSGGTGNGSSSHHFVHLGMKTSTLVVSRVSNDSKNTSSSSGQMSSLSELSSHFGDFRFESHHAHNSYTEQTHDGPLQMPIRASSMSTISSHSYSTLTTQSTFSRVTAHLPATAETAEEEDNKSTSSEVKLENDESEVKLENGAESDKKVNGDDDDEKKQHKHSRSWDGVPSAPPVVDSPLQKPRRKASFNVKKE